MLGGERNGRPHEDVVKNKPNLSTIYREWARRFHDPHYRTRSSENALSEKGWRWVRLDTGEPVPMRSNVRLGHDWYPAERLPR
jgi:hypothetical protein